MIDVFGLSWSATTIATPVINTDPMSNKQWITMGVRFAIEMDGKVWEKDGWDSVEIKTYSYGEKQGHWIDLGNNFKQAYSQALKKAVTQIGIALYLYFGEGGLPDELDPMPDNLITFSNNELPPSSPSWGAGAIDPPEEINRSFQEVPQYKEEIPDDLFASSNNEIGTGVGYTSGPGAPVTATAMMQIESEDERPSTFMINAIKMGINDEIKSGKIQEPIEEFIQNITGLPNLDKLNKSQAQAVLDHLVAMRKGV